MVVYSGMTGSTKASFLRQHQYIIPRHDISSTEGSNDESARGDIQGNVRRLQTGGNIAWND